MFLTAPLGEDMPSIDILVELRGAGMRRTEYNTICEGNQMSTVSHVQKGERISLDCAISFSENNIGLPHKAMGSFQLRSDVVVDGIHRGHHIFPSHSFGHTFNIARFCTKNETDMIHEANMVPIKILPVTMTPDFQSGRTFGRMEVYMSVEWPGATRSKLQWTVPACTIIDSKILVDQIMAPPDAELNSNLVMGFRRATIKLFEPKHESFYRNLSRPGAGPLVKFVFNYRSYEMLQELRIDFDKGYTDRRKQFSAALADIYKVPVKVLRNVTVFGGLVKRQLDYEHSPDTVDKRTKSLPFHPKIREAEKETASSIEEAEDPPGKSDPPYPPPPPDAEHRKRKIANISLPISRLEDMDYCQKCDLLPGKFCKACRGRLEDEGVIQRRVKYVDDDGWGVLASSSEEEGSDEDEDEEDDKDEEGKEEEQQ